MKLTFVWEALFDIGATLKAANHWVPTMKFRNDVAIMDALIETQRKTAGTTSFLPDQRIVFANACRLWLRITTLSDIVDASGTKIMDWAMNGEKQKTIDGEFPYQQKPPQHVWKEWRMALRQSFLRRPDDNSQDHQLLSPLQEPLNPSVDFTWTPKIHM